MTKHRYDGHVHLVGNGLSGSGCWLRLDGLWHRALGEVMRRTIGLRTKAIAKDFDESFVRHLAGLLADGLATGSVDTGYTLPSE